MKKLLFLLFVAFLPLLSYSQINKDGLPFINHYTGDEDFGAAGQIWAIEQDKRGVMYFGCNYGLKTFDGKNWKSYNLPNTTIIRSLSADQSGLVYYGAETDFGVIKADSIGDLSFYSLYLEYFKNPDTDFSSVWKTLIADNKVYFQCAEKLFYTKLPIKIDKNDSLLNTINIVNPDKAPFHASFSVHNKFYVREWEKGLGTIEDDKMVLIPGGEQFAYLRVYVMLPYSDTEILIGTRNAGFFLYDTKKEKDAITPFQVGPEDFIRNSVLYTGTALGNELFALGTFVNGIIIFNKEGKIINHFNKSTGLSDDKILSIYFNQRNDNASNLWFANNDIVKANVFNPMTTWNETSGLSGVVSDAIRFNDVLYVSTNNGLYSLESVSGGKSYFKKIQSLVETWDLFEFYVAESGEKLLLLSSQEGVFVLQNNELVKIAEIQGSRKLYQLKAKDNSLFVGTVSGLHLLKYENRKWVNKGKHEKIFNEIKSILELKDYIALGTADAGLLMLKNFEDSLVIKVDSAKGLPLEGKDFFLHQIKDKIVVASGAGLYSINDTSAVDSFVLFGSMYTGENKAVYTFMEDENAYWMSVYETNTDDANHRLIRFIDKENLVKDSLFSRILPQKSTNFLYPDGNYVWIGNERGLFKFNKNRDKEYNAPFTTLITKVGTIDDSILFAGNYIYGVENILTVSGVQNDKSVPVLEFKHNKLIFEWAAPFYEKENETEYSYRLTGETDQWSKWTKKNDTRYTNLYEGDYTFEVKARNIFNTESSIAKYSFTILPPWYRTIWAYFIFAVLGIFAIFIIIKVYTKKLKRENEKLEQTVKERTAEIRMQNEEITAQRDEIQEQKEQVEQAKDKIERQQKSIMDSIHYASRIQEAVLPPDEYLQDVLGDHFVLFKPRDIVSGDFYWATRRGNKTVIVAADCTGHGVPGAFMSMLGISFLNEIVNKEEVLQANIILNRLRENVKRSLRQTGKDNEAKDGMDIAICIIDIDNMQLQFAGAYNPLLILRNNEIQRVKSDRMPIGIYLREKESFTNNIVDLQKGDLLYIFSDGYVDQFGGENDKKITSSKFKEVLLENHKKSLEEQKIALVKHLDHWMSYKDKTGRTYKQVDDILVIGIEI